MRHRCMNKAGLEWAGTAQARARAIAVVLGMACAAPAAGQSQPQPKANERWAYEASPYLWGAGLDGSTTVGALTAESSHSASDLLDKLDFGFAGGVEARKGRWGILFDGMYMKLSDDVDTARGRVDIELVQQMYAPGGAWRALEGRTPVDLIAGVRYHYLPPRLELDGLVREQSKHALDPFIGARVHYSLDGRWALIGHLDAGTFDGSDYAWQLLAGASYASRPDRSIKFGNRRLQNKYSGEAIEVDTTMHGLYIGMGFRF